MNVLITGVTGLLGRSLSQHLTDLGHQVIGLSRSKNEQGDFWDPLTGTVSISQEKPIDAVIHLAGDNIASGRWTRMKKESVLKSRTQGTQVISSYLAGLLVQPKVMISASGIGYYGETGDREVDETGTRGSLFISDVCRQWEFSTEAAQAVGIRVIHARLGMVLSPDAGGLAKMLPAFRAGVGGMVGNGKQWMSWVTLKDVVECFVWMLSQHQLAGPVNVVSPGAVSNRDFTKALAGQLGRKAWMPMPALMIKLLFGKMGEELLLSSCRVNPAKLLESGYPFHHSRLDLALKDVLKKCAPECG